MNNKALKFSNYIQQNMGADSFIIKEMSDDMHTTLFYSNIKLPEALLLKSFVLFDDSQNILIRVNLKENIDKQCVDMDRCHLVLNELNQQYPLFKFYYDQVAKCIVLEMMHVAHDEFFEPKILRSQLVWIINHAFKIYQKITEIV